jgi:hypothetical protein
MRIGEYDAHPYGCMIGAAQRAASVFEGPGFLRMDL